MNSGAQLLAANLARLRAQKHLSQVELARLLGIAPMAVEALENATNPDLTLDEIDALAKALGVDPLALFQPV